MAKDKAHAEKYNSTEVKLFYYNTPSEPTKAAFLAPCIEKYLSSEAPDQKVLDIGCGTGDWTKYTAKCGAKSVNGFDINEEMVELSKKTTKGLSNVTICGGNVANMPYGNDNFDLALSIFVTCVLPKELFIKHFSELYRVLAPGGKALVLNFARSAFDVMFLGEDSDRALIEKRIETTLAKLPCYPSNQKINEAFADFHDIIILMLTLNDSGRLCRVTDIAQLVNGQAVWTKATTMVFPDYFYTADFINEQIKAAGFHLDYIENCFTEENRIRYNNSNPKIKLDKAIIEDPPILLYHLSKPQY